MELKTAIEILEYHQEWRLGKREDMIHEPKKLTQALDIVLSEVKKFRLGAVSSSALLPDGWRIYKCTDCQEINVKKDNRQITVGFCDKCEHPLWNDDVE